MQTITPGTDPGPPVPDLPDPLPPDDPEPIPEPDPAPLPGPLEDPGVESPIVDRGTLEVPVDGVPASGG